MSVPRGPLSHNPSMKMVLVLPTFQAGLRSSGFWQIVCKAESCS